MLKKWERTNRAQFEAKKTLFIYLTRYKEVGKDVTTPFQFKGKGIPLTQEIKILRVILDKKLQFKAHLADKIGKATKVVLVLRRLKGLQSKNVKQLAKSLVLPVADYALPIWYLLVI